MIPEKEVLIRDEEDTRAKFYRTKSDNESSKNVESDLEFVFGWNRFNLGLIGLWPEQLANSSDSSFSAITKYRPPMICLWIFSILVVPQVMALLTYTFVLSEIIDIIISLTVFAALIVRILVIWLNVEARCLLCVTEDWSRKLTSMERHCMMKYATLGRRVTIGVCIFVQSTIWSYLIMKTVELFNLNLHVENSTELGKQLFRPSYFPIDLSKLSNFGLVWLGQFLGIIAVAPIGICDSFVATLIFHICGQITVLRHNITNLVDPEATVTRPEKFRTDFTSLVKQHDKIATLASVFTNTIDFMILVLVLTYTIQLGLQLFSLLTIVTERSKSEGFPFMDVLFFASYLNLTIIYLFLYCYVGEMLIQESESLTLACYSCAWYNLSSKNAKDLIMVMNRAADPLQMWAGKFVPLSLDLFGNVLKTSMGYFSMLLSVMERSAK